MPDSFNGLPVHPLVVHFAVVVALLAAAAAVLFIIPRTRGWARMPLLLLALGAMVTAFVAKETGEPLEDRVRSGAGGAWRGSALADAIGEHAEAADLLFLLTVVFALVAGVAFRSSRRTEGLRGTAEKAVCVALALGALGLGVQMYVVGDAGAKAVWNHTVTLGPATGAG